MSASNVNASLAASVAPSSVQQSGAPPSGTSEHPAHVQFTFQPHQPAPYDPNGTMYDSDSDTVGCISTPAGSASPVSEKDDNESKFPDLLPTEAGTEMTLISPGDEDAADSMPSMENDPKGFVVFVRRESQAWLRAFDDGKFLHLDWSIYITKKEKANVMRLKLEAWRKLLDPTLLPHLYAGILSTLDLDPVQYEALGGRYQVEAEQTAWHDYIKKTGRADIYVEEFILEQKACGRKPSKLTDFLVKVLSNMLLEDMDARIVVNSLRACNRTEDWDPQ